MNAEQEREEDSEYEDSPREPIAAKVNRAIRIRWVQAVLVLFCGLAAIGLSAAALKPKREKFLDPKFLRCPKCDFETKYTEKQLNEECIHCREEPVGRLEPQTTSIKEELGKKSPWRWFHISAAIEGLITIVVILFLMKRPVRDPGNTYYVFSCPYCSQRLRFRRVSLGGLGQCSRCKRPVRFPTEGNAVLEEDLIREEQERMDAEADDNEDEE
jgi:hypothetical protein